MDVKVGHFWFGFNPGAVNIGDFELLCG
jgi:hypothetical protein